MYVQYVIYSVPIHASVAYMGRVTIWTTTHPEMPGSIKIFNTVILNHYYIYH